MGVIIICAVLLLILSIPFISYYILKYYGFKKTGIAVGLIVTLIILIPIFLYAFESQLYFKSDARKDLQIAGIILNDDFEIDSNSIVGLTDYYQTTSIKVSEKDRDIIINKIKNNKNFEILDPKEFQGNLTSLESNNSTCSYKTKDEYVLETYKKRAGHRTIRIMISVKKNSNVLSLLRTED